MEKHCSTISFGLKNRKDKSGMSPITMTIGANGERAEFQTGRKIAPENWDNGKQQAKGKTTEAKLLNAYLNQLRNKVYLKEIELMQRGYLITARLLRDAVIDKVEALTVHPAANLVDYAHPKIPKFIVDPNTKEVPDGFVHIKESATKGMDKLIDELNRL